MKRSFPMLCAALAAIVTGCAMSVTTRATRGPNGLLVSTERVIAGTDPDGQDVSQIVKTTYPSKLDDKACTTRCENILVEGCIAKHPTAQCNDGYRQCAAACGAQVSIGTPTSEDADAWQTYPGEKAYEELSHRTETPEFVLQTPALEAAVAAGTALEDLAVIEGLLGAYVATIDDQPVEPTGAMVRVLAGTHKLTVQYGRRRGRITVHATEAPGFDSSASNCVVTFKAAARRHYFLVAKERGDVWGADLREDIWASGGVPCLFTHGSRR
jgi:hypothetical protein